MKQNRLNVVALILILASLLVLLCGCLSDSDFPTFTCKYCGAGGLSETEYKNNHGVKACVAAAPCGADGHYVLTGQNVDMNGVNHTAKCTLCEGYLCTGEHGEGVCIQKPDAPSPQPSEEPESSDATLGELSLEVASANNGQTQVDLSVQASSQTVPTTYYAGDVISINAVPNDPLAVVTEGVSNVKLSEGDNTFSITVIAEDGKTTVTRTVTVHAEAPLSDDCSLKTFVLILPNGTQIDMRDPIARKNITVTDVRNATVNAVAKSSKANVTGDMGNISIAEGENTYRVKVTAESGKTASFEYRIVMENKPAMPPRSTDATLKSLTAENDGGPLTLTPTFSPGKLEGYTATSGLASIVITGTANHPGATVSGDGEVRLSDGENVLNIVVTAEDGVTKNTYVLTITAYLR